MIFILVFVFIMHFVFINPMEKLVTQAHIGLYNRPKEECKDKTNFHCLGMPSGHAEITSLLCMLLYLNDYIPLSIAITGIILVGIQRIVTNMHTLNQVIAGTLLGSGFAYLYFKLQKPIYIVIVASLYALTLWVFLKDKPVDWPHKEYIKVRSPT